MMNKWALSLFWASTGLFVRVTFKTEQVLIPDLCLKHEADKPLGMPNSCRPQLAQIPLSPLAETSGGFSCLQLK